VVSLVVGLPHSPHPTHQCSRPPSRHGDQPDSPRLILPCSPRRSPRDSQVLSLSRFQLADPVHSRAHSLLVLPARSRLNRRRLCIVRRL
jgi:hypothetical protein